MDRAPQRLSNPWIVLVLEIILVTGSETLVKIGASRTARIAGWEWTGLTGLGSVWIWCAIGLVILSFLCWIYVLRYIPLSIAFPLSQVVHVLVPLSSWIFLSEHISPRRWCGIAVVILGLAVMAKPVAKLEEQL